MTPRRALAPILVLVLITSACAGTLRDRVRTTAMTAGEIALTVDQSERSYRSIGIASYTPEAQQKAGAAILQMLQAVQVFERAARAWPETWPRIMPASMLDAQQKALASIAAVQRIFEPLPQAAGLLDRLGAVQQAIGGGK
jgi:hypothetical protein